VTLGGFAEGALGFGNGEGRITLTPDNSGTGGALRIRRGHRGKVASIGGRLLDGAARVIIGQFFSGLAVRPAARRRKPGPSLMCKFLSLFGRRS